MAVIDVASLEKRYLNAAEAHNLFREKYCKEGAHWRFDDLLEDDAAIAHYMIVETKRIRPHIEAIREDSEEMVAHLVGKIKKFLTNEASITNKDQDAELNRLAKIFVFLAWYGFGCKDIFKDLLLDLSDSEKHNRSSYNVGPRQLYDYAIFALWSIYEQEYAATIDGIPF